jgi:tetratricopeptide (TPR) repeat protein
LAAERRARQVIQANPKSAMGYNLLAEAAHFRGQAAVALDALRKAHEVDKSQASLSKLMRATFNQQGAKPALELGDTWLKRNPNDLAVRSVMAEVHVRGGDFAAARKQYEAILKQRPNHAETLNSLANVLMETKDPGAVAMAERAYKADAQNPLLMDTAGWANHLAGNNDRALQLLREARLRAPDIADIRYHLGAVLAKAGRNAEAREELQAALRANVKFSSVEAARKLLLTLN